MVVPEIPETTALGAAYLAGIGAGVWLRDQIAGMWKAGQTFEPRMSRELAGELIGEWHRAVERSREWAREKSE